MSEDGASEVACIGYGQELMKILQGLKRRLLLVAGTLFVLLGVIGIFVPLLPTTPFLLLAAACYAASSERFYQWLLNNSWFGGYIKNYREGRGLPLKAKIISVSSLWITIGYSIIFVVPMLIGRLALIAIAAGVTQHILSKPTYEPRQGR